MSEQIDTSDSWSMGLADNSASAPACRNILGVNVSVTTAMGAIERIEKTIAQGRHQKLAFLNAHGANIACLDSSYRAILQQFQVLADGVGVDVGSKILYGENFPENLNGTDFIPALFANLKKPVRVALFGAGEGVAEAAADAFALASPQHRYEVVGNGYVNVEEGQQILSRLEELKPGILIVAMGNPLQERWIAEKCTPDHASVAIGVGALFDFMAGRVARAPQWMISLRLEWLYRLWLEPSRMWRRYLLGNPLFVLRVMKQKIFGAEGQS